MEIKPAYSLCDFKNVELDALANDKQDKRIDTKEKEDKICNHYKNNDDFLN